MKKIHFFLDFDGTITTVDVVDALLENFASGEWKQIEKRWIKGGIGSRECLERQMELVSANEAKVSDLLSTVRLDPGFAGFLEKAAGLGVPVTVVSDGFRWVIEKVFQANLNGASNFLKDVPIFANDLVWNGAVPRAVFSAAPCEHGCANCKAAVIRQLRLGGEKVVFVGDGLSDRYAAQASDLTFAKGKLLDWCRGKKILHQPYLTFQDIERWLIRHSESAPSASLRAGSGDPASS